MDSHLSSPVCSDEVIEALVVVACGHTASVQAKHIYRESLRNLVRLAKAEQTQETKLGLHRLPNDYGEGLLH